MQILQWKLIDTEAKLHIKFTQTRILNHTYTIELYLTMHLYYFLGGHT